MDKRMKRPAVFYYCAVICFLLLLSVVQISSAESKKVQVLFIGNSLTSVNNLPQLTADLAKSRHYTMEYEAYCPGGYRLSQHSVDQNLLAKINKGGWDFVVLQEQSQLPAFSQEQIQREGYPYAKKLSALIRQTNPQARIVFYMTMANRNGDPQNVRFFPEVRTYHGMQKRINNTYMMLARQNSGLLAPVGEVWENVQINNPEINLYADDVHPNLTGSYLAAFVLYATIFKDRALGLPHPNGIDNTTAESLQKAAENVISSRSWDWSK